MQLFSFDYANRQFSVDATPATGEETISVDGVVVSQQRNFGITSEHTFVLDDVGEVKLIYVLNMRAADVNYELWVNAERVLEALRYRYSPASAGRISTGVSWQLPSPSAARTSQRMLA